MEQNIEYNFTLSEAKEMVAYIKKTVGDDANFKSFSIWIRYGGGRRLPLLKQLTRKLDDHYENPTESQRAEYVLNREIPMCPNCCIRPRSYFKPKGKPTGYWPSCGVPECTKAVRRDSFIKTNLEKYGTEHYMQSDEGKAEYRKKIKESTGYDHNWKNPEVRKQISEKRDEVLINTKRVITMRKRYGSSDMCTIFLKPWLKARGIKTAMDIPEVVEKVSFSNIQTKELRLIQIIENIKTSPIYPTRITQTDMEFCCSKCGNFITRRRSYIVSEIRDGIDPCTVCSPPAPPFASKGEMEVTDFIESLGVSTEKHVRTLLGDNRECDIYVPSTESAFEYNGIYWHANKSNDDTNRNYHQSKSISALQNGITLYHVWEDDWKGARPVMEGMIRSVLQPVKKFDAIACDFKEIPVFDALDFYVKNSTLILGSLPYRAFSLTHNGNIATAILTFFDENDAIYIMQPTLLSGCALDFESAFLKKCVKSLKLTDPGIPIKFMQSLSWPSRATDPVHAGFSPDCTTGPERYVVDRSTARSLSQKENDRDLHVYGCGYKVWSLK